MLITESKLNRDRHLHPFVTIPFVHTHTRSAVHSNQIATEDHSELRSSFAPSLPPKIHTLHFWVKCISRLGKHLHLALC